PLLLDRHSLELSKPVTRLEPDDVGTNSALPGIERFVQLLFPKGRFVGREYMMREEQRIPAGVTESGDMRAESGASPPNDVFIGKPQLAAPCLFYGYGSFIKQVRKWLATARGGAFECWNKPEVRGKEG